MSKIKIRYKDSKTGDEMSGITNHYDDILDMLEKGIENGDKFMLDSGETVAYKCVISMEDKLDEAAAK